MPLKSAKYAVTIAGLLGVSFVPASGQTVIVGDDEKQGIDQNYKPILREPGHDTLSILDISNPAAPRVAVSIPLINSVAGPPTNLAITPSGELALVANSLAPVVQGWGRRLEPDNKVFVVDLKANPPQIVGTVTVGKQPSGLAINPAGNLALVTNRGDGTISVLTIHGHEVLVVGTVTVGTPEDQVSAVAITPDGRHAIATRPAANKVALLTINDEKVTNDKRDLPTGIFPYNVAISPDGRLALTADSGNGGSSDGNADTVGVIDLAANPPRVVDHVTVGDSPEGLAISPQGNLAVSVQAEGSNAPPSAFYHHNGGSVAVLAINGNRVTRVGSIAVGRLPEAVAFSRDGSHIYVGNFLDGDLSILQVNGTNVIDTGRHLKLPGQPASMRAGPQ